MVAPSAALWKLAMDPLLGGVGSTQPAEVVPGQRKWQTYDVVTLVMHSLLSYLQLYIHILYSGKLSREKTFVNWWKKKPDFCGENFRRLLAFAAPKDVMPQISRRKLSCIATKLRKSWKLSPSKVFAYMVNVWTIILHTYYCMWEKFINVWKFELSSSSYKHTKWVFWSYVKQVLGQLKRSIESHLNVSIIGTSPTLVCSIVILLENVEHCGVEPEQADTGILCHWWVM